MAGHCTYFFVAALVIHSHTTDAKSTCLFDKAVIEDHLLEEKERKFSCQRLLLSSKSFHIICSRISAPNSFIRNIPDPILSLIDGDKQLLCNEVARTLIGVDKLRSLLGKGDLEEPRIAKKCHRFIPRDVRIEGLDMVKLMFWCEPRKFEKNVSKSEIGQMEGFFCAGSPRNSDRVYVFRTKHANADEVEPVAEVNNWWEIDWPARALRRRRSGVVLPIL